MSSRQISQRANNFWPICAGLGLVCVTFLVYSVSSQGYAANRSGGDYGIPTFAGSGTFRDGSRSATFNGPTGFNRGKSAGPLGLGAIISTLLLCAFLWWLANPPHGQCGCSQCLKSSH